MGDRMTSASITNPVAAAAEPKAGQAHLLVRRHTLSLIARLILVRVPFCIDRGKEVKLFVPSLHVPDVWSQLPLTFTPLCPVVALSAKILLAPSQALAALGGRDAAVGWGNLQIGLGYRGLRTVAQTHTGKQHSRLVSGNCRQGARKSISHASPSRPNGHLQRMTGNRGLNAGSANAEGRCRS